MSTNTVKFSLVHVQDVIVTSRWPYVCNVAKPFSGHKSRSPAYHILISINNSWYHLKTLCNIPRQLNHTIQFSPSSTYNSMSSWKKSFCFNLMSIMLTHSMRISIKHLSKMTQPLVQCAGKGVAGWQKKKNTGDYGGGKGNTRHLFPAMC